MDKRKVSLLFCIIAIIGLGVAGYFFISGIRKNSGLRIETFPKAKVILNGLDVGETPFYKEGLEAKEYSVKLIPQSGNTSPYETKIGLSPQALTILTRVFSTREEFASGELITLEKSGVDIASMSVVSDPDAIIVKVDGEDKGLSPLTIKNLSPGSHEIIVSKPGYDTQTINGTLISGYDLHLIVKLPKSADLSGPISSSSASLQASSSGNINTKQVLILPTPTGFLRVRVSPSTSASEFGKVSPGEKYELLGEQTGWVNIKIASHSGWVSADYTSVQ